MVNRFFKSYTFILIVLLSITVSANGQSNLLTNGNFELNLANWTTMTGDGTASFIIDRNVYKEGTSSLRVNVSKAGSNPWSVQCWNNSLSVKTGQFYQVVFWAKAAAHGGKFDALVQRTTGDFRRFHTITVNPDTVWTRYTFSFTSDVTYLSGIGFTMQFPVEGVFYFDDIQVFTSEELIPNGGFESGILPWNNVTSGDGIASFHLETNDVFEGNRALRINVTQSGAAAADIQTISRSFTANTVFLYSFSFMAKGIVPGQKLNLVFQSGSTTQTKEFILTGDWKQYSGFFSCTVTRVDYQLRFQYLDEGTYFLDDIRLETTTEHQQWMKDIDNRIDEIRKGNFRITLLDANNNPVQGDVNIEMTKHDFEWGLAIEFWNHVYPAITYNAVEENWFLETAVKYFNSGVVGNSMKWYAMEPQDGIVSYAATNQYINWTRSVGWKLRGHTLIWGSRDPWTNPDWLHPEYSWNGATTRPPLPVPTVISRVKRRVERDTKYFENDVQEWDVVNEPIHVKYLSDYVGDSINWLAFKWAKAAAPNVRLFVNDYNILTYEDQKNTYKNYIRKMLANGAPIDGIGLQGHFGSSANWDYVVSALNDMANLGLPLKITEFDMGNQTEEKQAEEYGKMLKVAFSHPAMEGFYFWGMWDKRHWRGHEGAGMFRVDRTPKPSAEVVYDLIHNEWKTRENVLSDTEGSLSFRGFFGNYMLKVNIEGVVHVAEVHFPRSEGDQEVVLKLSPAVSIADKAKSVTPVFYPNPAKNTVHVEMLIGARLIQIFNSSGLILDEVNVENLYQAKLDLSRFKDGLFLARVIYLDGKIITEKIIKN